MKIQTAIIGLLCLVFLSSFGKGEPEPPSKSYSLIYIDNSKVPGKLSLSEEMIDLLSRRIDSIKLAKSGFLLFLSNSLTPGYTRKFDEAKKIAGDLYNGYSAMPAGFTDKRLLSERLFEEDFTGIGTVNIYFFVTENYLQSDQAGENLGLFMGFLPRQLQVLTRSPEENINVYLYYPKGSASVQDATFRSFANFGGTLKDFGSKIKFHFLTI